MHLYDFLKQYKIFIYCLLLATSLAGCAAAGIISSAVQVATNMAGVEKKAPDPNATKDVTLKIQAETLLNSDTQKRSYSLVVRIYHLKQSASFQQAFYDVFLDENKEKEAIGADVISKKEITLIPGQAYNNVEKVNINAESIGVVAFFQKPAAKRWKFTFPVKSISKEGLSLNVGACSVTVMSGSTLEFGAAQQNILKTPANCG